MNTSQSGAFWSHLLRRASGKVRYAGTLLEGVAKRMDSLANVQRSEILRRNLELKGRHQGRTAFVIGNGPSLTRQDIAPLKAQVTFVMNAFWKHPMVERWNPTYYSFADLAYFDGSPASLSFLETVTKKVPASTFLLPLWTRSLIDPVFSKLSRYYLPIDDRFVSGPGVTGVDLARARPQSIVNTTLVCLMTAIYMRCSPIYLLGMDHDWLAHRVPYGHFYSGPTIDDHETADPKSHEKYSYASWMRSTLWLWQDYATLKRIAESCGIEIYNATDGGFLDVFPRVDYESLIRTSL